AAVRTTPDRAPAAGHRRWHWPLADGHHQTRDPRRPPANTPGATGTMCPSTEVLVDQGASCQSAATDSRSTWSALRAAMRFHAARASVPAAWRTSSAVVFCNVCRVGSIGFKSWACSNNIMSDVSAIPALSDNYIWAIAPAAAQPQAPVAIVD